MYQKFKSFYQARAAILKALSHPTRLFIVEQLAQKEQCVCKLTEMIGDHESTVSKHLAVLRNAGIVASEKRGVEVWYNLKVPCIVNFMGCIEETIRANAQTQMSLVEKEEDPLIK